MAGETSSSQKTTTIVFITLESENSPVTMDLNRNTVDRQMTGSHITELTLVCSEFSCFVALVTGFIIFVIICI